eukprot:CAMPEP_0197528690 /NCGR_PEP_ID=MMETSP1318-20131121/25989_1 /TAXON_ID=552666 /ORGANISM="Partenskyella glossopodia, Strain RCC365" /LENGTH=173 /DNA_ID=CAMNT_0043083879 /DNA_START=96 /DNA_END=617 /DNA_ORIENTATION=+
MSNVIENLQRNYDGVDDDEDSLDPWSGSGSQSNDYVTTNLPGGFRTADSLVNPNPPPPPEPEMVQYRPPSVPRRIPRSRGCPKACIDRLPTATGKAAGGNVQCMVCIMTVKGRESVRILPCFHKFHKRCIDKWLATSKECPVCKINIVEAIWKHDKQVAELFAGGVDPDQART